MDNDLVVEDGLPLHRTRQQLDPQALWLEDKENMAMEIFAEATLGENAFEKDLENGNEQLEGPLLL